MRDAQPHVGMLRSLASSRSDLADHPGGLLAMPGLVAYLSAVPTSSNLHLQWRSSEPPQTGQ